MWHLSPCWKTACELSLDTSSLTAWNTSYSPKLKVDITLFLVNCPLSCSITQNSHRQFFRVKRYLCSLPAISFITRQRMLAPQRLGWYLPRGKLCSYSVHFLSTFILSQEQTGEMYLSDTFIWVWHLMLPSLLLSSNCFQTKLNWASFKSDSCILDCPFPGPHSREYGRF